MIHYHGIPLSGGDRTHMALQSKHAFISYAHSTAAALVIEMVQSFALDNGAFSAFSAGKPFDIDGFAEFVDTWHMHPGHDFYIIPDSIGGDHHENNRMRAAWRNVCPKGAWQKGYPVWHMHEPLEVLRDLCNEYRGVALGSSGEYFEVGTHKWWHRMSEAMDIATDEQGRPLAKLHGLRLLDPTCFSHLPLSSADSTNVARNASIDKAWGGPYAPVTSKARALCMMDRIESHASASHWSNSRGVTKNMDLFG